MNNPQSGSQTLAANIGSKRERMSGQDMSNRTHGQNFGVCNGCAIVYAGAGGMTRRLLIPYCGGSGMSTGLKHLCCGKLRR